MYDDTKSNKHVSFNSYVYATSNYTDNENKRYRDIVGNVGDYGAYTGKALVKRNSMNKSISIIRHVFVLDIFNFSAM